MSPTPRLQVRTWRKRELALRRYVEARIGGPENRGATARSAGNGSTGPPPDIGSLPAEILIDLVDGSGPSSLRPSARPYPVDYYYAVGRVYAQVVTRSTPARAGSAGLFYTPRWVALRLVDLVRDEAGDGSQPGVGGGVAKGIRRVVDPACGAGALLLAWLERLPDAKLVGRDVDSAALALAQTLLQHYAGDRDISIDLDLERRDLFAVSRRAASRAPEHTSASALSPREPSVERTTGAILLNPPYGTHLGDSAQRFAERARLTGREPDMFALSVERILAMAGGPVGLILPDVVRMQPEYGPLRRHLVDAGRIRRLEMLRFGAFPEATVRPCLLCLGPPNGCVPSSLSAESAAGSGHLPVVVKTPSRSSHTVDLGCFAEDRLCRWSLVDPRLERLWTKCRQGSARLGEVARCHEGIHTGNIRHKLFTDDADAPSARPLLKGADVRPFAATFRRRYARYDRGLIDRAAGEYASLRDERIFEPPKLFSRQTSDRLIVCIDRSDTVSDNSLHSIKVSRGEGVSLEWLALYLNSSLATALYRHQSGEWDRPLPQIKLKLLRRLPVRAPMSPSEVERLLERAEREARDGPVSPETIAAIDGFVFDTFGVHRSDREWIVRMVR